MKVPSSSTAVSTTGSATQNAILSKVFDCNEPLSPQVKERFEMKFNEQGRRKD